MRRKTFSPIPIRGFVKGLLLMAMILVIGVKTASAYTKSDLTAAGWTKITSISQADITNNYYIFLSENEDLILGLAQSSSQGTYSAFYQTLADPAADSYKVWTIEVNGDNYAMRNLKMNARQMQTEYSNSNNDKRWRVNDQTGSCVWTGLGITAIPEGKFTLTSTQYNRPLGIYGNGTGTPTAGKEIGANDIDEQNKYAQKFCIYSISKSNYWKILVDNASELNPLDFTGAISNPEIYNGNKGNMPRGWTEETSIRQTGNSNRTAGTGINRLEAWTGGATLRAHYYQEITGIPSGRYKLTALAGDSNGSGGGEIYISCGNNKKAKGMPSGDGADITTDYVNSTGSITIGMTANGSNSWVHAENFRLYYLGEDLSESLAIAKDDATAIDQTKPMNADVKANLQSAIESYGNKGANDFESTAALKNAITALSNAAEAANTSIENYEAAKAILDAASKLDEDGKAAYAADENVAALKTAYDNGTLEAVTAEQKTACEAALLSAVKAQTTAGSDMTLAINNWDFENCSNNNFPGWTISAPNGGNTWAHGSTCVEYWIGTAANGKFDYYQTITDLPYGKYTLTASMWNSTDNGGGSANEAAGVYGTSGANTVFKGVNRDTRDNDLAEYTTDELIVSDGTIRLGVKNNGTMGAKWFGVDWIKLTLASTKLTAADVAALEEKIPEGAMNADVKTALDEAKAALDAEATWDNYAALSEAIEAANASIAAYENAAQWLPVNKAELANTNFIAPEVYKEYITDVETGLEDGTLTDEKALSLTDIRVGHHAANYIDDILMDAWDAEPMDWNTYHINTWSTEGDNDGSDFKTPFFEYWTGDNNSLEAKEITGTIEGLEPGDYAVTAWVRVRVKNGSNDLPDGIKMYVNDGETQPIEGTKIDNSKLYLQKASAFGTVGEDGKLTVTFVVNEDNNISWLAFKNVNYVKGAASIADFKATTEPTLLNLNGTEAFFVDDEGITYIQDANANVGLAIKGYNIDFTEEKQLLSGQLYGTASGDTIIVEANDANSVIVSEGKATPKTLTPAEAALAESTFLLANIEQVEVTEEEEVKYAEAEDGKVEIDNRLCGELVVNTGDVLNTLAGITFLNEEGSNSVIAPREQDDVVPVLWKAPSGVNVGDAITASEPIDLTTDDVLARLANLKAGDVLNIAVDAPAEANIIVKNKNGVIYTIPVAAKSTNVEVPVTAFMEKDFQNHGVEISADNADLLAKYVTVRNAKYTDTENTIWLGMDNNVTLGSLHFGDVREGDLLELDSEDGSMAVGEETFASGELSEEQAATLLKNELTVTGASQGVTKVTFTLGDDMRLDVTDNKEGESFNQGDKDLSVEGMIMTYGGNDPEGAVYEYTEAYPAANNFATATEGIDQFPVDNEDKAYNKDDKNLPTKGTFYVFEPTKDGQIEATVGVEGGKTIIVTEEGEAILEEKKNADFEGPITFPVEATKAYYLFANDTNLKLFGFKFTPNDPNAENTVKDIETFKLLGANSIDGDTLLLKDAIVNYIHGDDVFVEDASGAIDFYRTQIQYYVGQKLNGYIIGSNDIVENMPVLLRTDGTKYGQFKVTDKVTPVATPATVADVTKDENLARFMKLEFVEVQRNERGFRVLVDPETQESVLIEDHFGVFYQLGDLMESIEGIVGKNSEGEFAFWPTSKEGTVISDGFKQMVETELDVTNKDAAKTKDNPVKGISVTLDSNCNAGAGSKMAGAMTSKGYKLRTGNGNPDKNSARFTVNDNQKVFDMTINAIANYAAKDAEKPCITVTKVEVDGKEVAFEGGEFPQKSAEDCGTLVLKGINAEKDIVIYFDNSNAEGTQLNMAYEIVCRGEKVYTQKEKDLMAEAKKLAEDREAVAVGLLDDAIEAAEAGNTNGLQAAVDQFKADNAESTVDYTDKVGREVANWVNVQNGADFKFYSGNGVNLVQVFGVTGEGDLLTQDVEVEEGTYYIGLYATSHNAWDGKYGANTAGKPTLQEDAGDVAYVFATTGETTAKTWIVARRNSALTTTEPEIYMINGLKVTNGKITLGLALAKAAQTEWHSIQIASLKKITTAKEAYAAEKAKLVALLEEAEGLLAGDQIGGRAKFEAAVAEANEAKESIRLNIEGMANEVAKLQAAIEKFHAAGKVFVLNVATGKYLAAGANWGTHAVLNSTGLDYDIKKLEDGTMTFDSQVSNGGSKNYLNGEWNDGEAFGWTVEQLSNGNYTIFNGEKYLCAGDDDLVVLGDNADEWSFVSVADRKESLAAATSEAPVDATFLIKGANFGRNDKRNNSWEVSKDCTNKNLSGGEKNDGSMGNNCAESYHSTFTISQVVADAPAGTYVLTAQGFYRQDDNAAEDAPVYFANDEKQAIGEKTGTENSMTDAGISFKDGLYPLQSITVVVEEDGTLTIGVQGTGTHQWVIWDNFQLMYYGVGGEPTTKINEVKEIAEPAAVRNSFEDGAIYNLRGQKMEGTLKPGLYIKNGKKFVIK